MIGSNLAATFVVALTIALPAAAQDAGTPSADLLSEAYTGKVYSPYAHRAFPERPLWGDSHLHTALSMDAGLFGNRLPPREAYRLARGEEVVSSTGQLLRLSRPLDWLVVADHSDGMGMVGDIIRGKPELLAYEQAARWGKGIAEGGDAAVAAALDLITNVSQGTMDPEMFALYSPGSKTLQEPLGKGHRRRRGVQRPGAFHGLHRFRVDLVDRGNNMHRVVMMRDGRRARQVVPYHDDRAPGQPDPRDLWKYLANYEEETGGEILAIAHNGNLSNGIMFPLEAQWNGTELDETYVTERAKWEPAYEITQIKGDGEAHPFLSPDDEFADYETGLSATSTSAWQRPTTCLPRVCPRGAEARAGGRGPAGHQPLQVRRCRRHRQPHLACNRRGGQFLRQAFRLRTQAGENVSSVHGNRGRRRSWVGRWLRRD